MLSDDQIRSLKKYNLLDKYFDNYLIVFEKRTVNNPKSNPNFDKELNNYLKKKGWSINHVQLPEEKSVYNENGHPLFLDFQGDIDCSEGINKSLKNQLRKSRNSDLDIQVIQTMEDYDGKYENKKNQEEKNE